ncbi:MULTISPECIES: lysine biosynthesis protein LysX [Acetomicrobium]|jgi:[lysine-biosynthesis-protein LysW]--L-2-aminoadipate ligase|uniref:lysine biosynthesis protein LysX n=1 Tax=Acetomicrobium TaxID=49894 RepID=UPI0026EFCB0C|nr:MULTISPECIES: lysine biosynthesis protein LysX [Acetomicrobium]MDR9769314.1 lysine biosynthesis protein LysX [Acetomicrobium sp.]HOB10210.1 lysine biosynthesis protein LysX [Acetomicrobium sp.]HPT64618.1 lysine biosynthesis protein LysX [Acetomicrobium sp.]HXK99600.1 lysine biosynthesis protein LysX [Acetomicrobium sp.]
MAKVFMFYSRLRSEEKMIIEAARVRQIPLEAMIVSNMVWPNDICQKRDVALCRCIGHRQNLALALTLEAKGVTTINPSKVMEICSDKIATSSKLSIAGIPQPDYAVAFSLEGALKCVEKMGYPVVLKPPVGSWGRLLAKVNDRDALEAIVEHKLHLGSQHSAIYIQKYVDKKGFDIRATIIGDCPASAIRRCSDHWITNTARGGEAQNYPLTNDLKNLLIDVQRAIGGKMLAVDVFETDNGFLVNEVNGQPEFRSSHGEITGVDIAGKIVEMAWTLAKKGDEDDF